MGVWNVSVPGPSLPPYRVLHKGTTTVFARSRPSSQLALVFGGACRNLETPSLKVGGVEDHIHILCRMAKVISISDLSKELKRESSKWVKQQKSVLRRFYWQSGYGAFSVSPSHVDGLIEYINNQKEHHKHESFQDEFRRLCKKYGVTIDERYVWN